jgi:PAS domain S-box-containing protein
MKSISKARGTAGESGSPSFYRVNAPLAFLFTLLAFVPLCTAQTAPKDVLVLSGGRGRVSINQMEASVRSHFSGQVNFSVVDLESQGSDQKAYQDNLAAALRAGYGNEKPDLVVAVMSTSFQFALQYRDRVFPGVPIVFMSFVDPLPDKLWPGVTGVLSTSGIAETIDLALRLQPDTKSVAIMTQGDSIDRRWLDVEHAELVRHRDKVEEIDIIGPASPDLLPKVAALPAHTIVLFQLYQAEANQPAFGAYDVLAAVTQRLPTYSISPALVLERGGIGGASYDPPTDAALAGELAARVLDGERADDIPVVHNSKPELFVNWQQLHRWNIPESVLPPGTHVVDREPTLWEQGRKYFLAATALIVVQSLLIFGLFWQRARRRKAEVELGKSEQKFSKAFRHSPLAITIVRVSDGCYVEVNETFELQTGWKRDEIIGRSPLDVSLWVDTDQRTAFLKQLLEKGNVGDFEVRFRRKDGQLRTGLGSAELIEVEGESCALSVIADITERKQAEEVIADFSGKLIDAQEAERTRIARELHDDINQRLAMVAVNLKTLKQDLPGSDVKMSRRIQEACEQVAGLENDIQALSHRLHSSKLEYLGLEAAAASLCTELSERQNVKIDFRGDTLPEDLPSEVSLCLFRVLQEALHNAMKYSGVGVFEVSLTGSPQGIELRVHDSGAGFDAKVASNGHGLGLTSMRERLKLVNGQFSIDSKPSQGTTVLARVPLSAETTTASAAA